jgi:hypothetical protein
MAGNGMARPRPALSLRAAAEEAFRKAQGACDAHISEWPRWSGLTENLLFTLAGRVCDGQTASRSPDDLLACLRKARAGRKGSCDWCHALRRLLADQPDADNLRLVDRFHAHEREACRLISEPAVWDSILRIARAFFVTGHLDGDEVRALASEAGLSFWPGPER